MPADSSLCTTLELSPRDFARGAAESVETDGEWTFHRFLPGQVQAYRDAGNEDFYRKTFATDGTDSVSAISSAIGYIANVLIRSE